MSRPKIRRLPITDLARIAIEPLENRLMLLEQVKGAGFGPNYNPTRKRFAGIVNRQPGALKSRRDPWRVVGREIVKNCRSLTEAKMNLRVALNLYKHCESNNINAVELDGFPIGFSVGPKLEAWSPALFVTNDRLTVPFLDLRKTRSLSPEAQRFIFSVQHHALRVNNPDYAEVEFQIYQFGRERHRPIKIIEEHGRKLFSYEQLEQMIAETHDLWVKVLVGRFEEAKATGTIGPLL